MVLVFVSKLMLTVSSEVGDVLILRDVVRKIHLDVLGSCSPT